jgi:hypothetical protein
MMAKAEQKAKGRKFSPSKHTAAVALTVAELRPAMEFIEQEFASRPEVLAFISKGEELGLDRETILKRMLSELALASDPHRRANELRFEVFKFCGLDPKRPLHWRVLFNAMIEVGFKSGGAPSEWDEVSYFELYSDMTKLRTVQSFESKEGLANELRKRTPFDRKYGTWKVGYLRKKVSEAEKMFKGVAPGTTFEEFVAERRVKELGLPPAFVRAYIAKARASVTAEMPLLNAETAFDPDVVSTILDEAEKQAALKRRDNSQLIQPKTADS